MSSTPPAGIAGRLAAFLRWLFHPEPLPTAPSDRRVGESGSPSFFRWLFAPERIPEHSGPAPGGRMESGFLAWLFRPEPLSPPKHENRLRKGDDR